MGADPIGIKRQIIEWETDSAAFGGTDPRGVGPEKQKGRASPTFHFRLCDQCQYIRGQSAKTVLCLSTAPAYLLSLMSSLSSLRALVNFSLTGLQRGGSSKPHRELPKH